MKKVFYITSVVLTLLFMIFTFVEIKKYIFSESNIFGLLYLILNFVILFILITVLMNFNKSNFKIWFSKILIILIFGIISCYVLPFISLDFIDYVDYSQIYINKIYLSLKVFKPIIYLVLLLMVLYEILVRKKSLKDYFSFKIKVIIASIIIIIKGIYISHLLVL